MTAWSARSTASACRSGRGETLAVVGESGSGKTVTARSVLKLIDMPPGRFEAGEIRWRGRDLLPLGPAAMDKIRAREIGMVFQEPMTSLNPVYPVGEQIAESLRAHREPVAPRRRSPTAVEMLRLVQIPNPERRVRDYPHQFSGGMRQRVMIAMALACKPQLLIADEPTTALDVTIQAQILELLAEMKERLGMAIMLITHAMGVVAENAQRVVVMYAGHGGGGGAGRRAVRQPAAPLHAGADPLDPARRCAPDRAAGAAGADPGQRAEPAASAAGLPVLVALPVRDGRLPRGRAAAAHRSAPDHKAACIRA